MGTEVQATTPAKAEVTQHYRRITPYTTMVQGFGSVARDAMERVIRDAKVFRFREGDSTLRCSVIGEEIFDRR